MIQRNAGARQGNRFSCENLPSEARTALLDLFRTLPLADAVFGVLRGSTIGS